jgi:hypothetical protein
MLDNQIQTCYNHGMNTWEHTLYFKDFYHNENFTISEKAEKVIVLFQNLLNKNETLLDDWNADDILLAFDEAKDDNDAETFDNAMAQLYDFADFHRIWIATV